MHLIIHMVARDQWADAQERGSYDGDTLATEGFIHCSTPQQTLWVANGRFVGRTDLLLVCIDADRLQFRATLRGKRNRPTVPSHLRLVEPRCRHRSRAVSPWYGWSLRDAGACIDPGERRRLRRWRWLYSCAWADGPRPIDAPRTITRTP